MHVFTCIYLFIYIYFSSFIYLLQVTFLIPANPHQLYCCHEIDLLQH